MNGFIKRVPVLTAGVLLLAGAGCGSDDETSGSDSVDVTLEEWEVGVSESSVPAGSVTLNASNAGTLEHELLIVRSDDPPGDLPVVDNRVPEDDPAVDIVDEIAEFEPGTESSGTFDLEAGSYILMCNIATHYEQGMYTEFTVT